MFTAKVMHHLVWHHKGHIPFKVESLNGTFFAR